jgi:Transposase
MRSATSAPTTTSPSSSTTISDGLVWAAPGRDKATLNAFFDALGPQRSAQITHVSADAADWIATVVAQRCPDAVRCADPFHVVAWATEALDEERRRAWNTARGALDKRRAGRATSDARKLKHARYALWKNPEDLTVNQQAKLAWIARTDPRLHRAYLLKEGLRHVFAIKGEEGKHALDRWLSWAQRCRIPSMVKLAQRMRRHRAAIDASLEHGLSNGLIARSRHGQWLPTATPAPGLTTTRPASWSLRSSVTRRLATSRSCGPSCSRNSSQTLRFTRRGEARLLRPTDRHAVPPAVTVAASVGGTAAAQWSGRGHSADSAPCAVSRHVRTGTRAVAVGWQPPGSADS